MIVCFKMIQNDFVKQIDEEKYNAKSKRIFRNII